MQDKMKRLLDQVGMTSEYFENAKIEKIVVYDKTNLWEFAISNDKPLPMHIYKELEEKLKENFKSIKDISIIINATDDSDYLEEYFDNLITSLADSSIKYRCFIGRNFDIDNEKIIFETYNKAEYTYMIEKKEFLNKEIRKYGYKKEIDIVLKEDKGNEILNEIEKDMVVEMPKVMSKKNNISETKTDEKKYFRPKKDTSVTKLKDIQFEIDNVTIEGMIFGIDMFESKSGYKIITLKVTDNTDSIYVKMFTKDNEEYIRIKDLLKEGSWYNFYGKVQMDKYSNELTFTTRYKDVEKIEAPQEEKIVDNEEVKRVELHAHTMMSQMDGITKIDLGKHTCELVSKCMFT